MRNAIFGLMPRLPLQISLTTVCVVPILLANSLCESLVHAAQESKDPEALAALSEQNDSGEK